MMKTTHLTLGIAVVVLGTLVDPLHAKNWTAGMQRGTPEIRSMGPLAFGPEGILLLANSSRGIMKISTDEIEGAIGITERVGDAGREGLPYETIEAWTGVNQLDRYDPETALVLRRDDAGSIHLESLPLP